MINRLCRRANLRCSRSGSDCKQAVLSRKRSALSDRVPFRRHARGNFCSHFLGSRNNRRCAPSALVEERWALEMFSRSANRLLNLVGFPSRGLCCLGKQGLARAGATATAPEPDRTSCWQYDRPRPRSASTFKSSRVPSQLLQTPGLPGCEIRKLATQPSLSSAAMAQRVHVRGLKSGHVPDKNGLTIRTLARAFRHRAP